MPRLARTFWFKSMSFFDQPLFNFWLVRLSARQIAIVFVFAILSYLTFTVTAFLGTMLAAAIALVVFGFGTGVFVPNRVFPTEWMILHAFKRRMARRTKGEKRRGVPSRATTPTIPERQPSLRGEMEEPLRVVGKLTHPQSGAPLSNVEYTVDVDGKPYHSGRTDAKGAYSLTFVPPSAGTYTLSFRQKGAKKETCRIKVNVVPQMDDSVKRGVAPPKLPTPAQTEEKEEETYAYELMPANFLTLDPTKQGDIVDRLAATLNALGKEVKIHIVKDKEKVDVGKVFLESVYMRFFIESPEPIDDILEAGGFAFQRVLEIPKPKVVRSLIGSTVLEGGRVCKTAVLYAIPATVVEGFTLSDLYRWIDRAVVFVRPVPQDEAVRRANNFAMQLTGVLHAEAQRLRTPPEEVRQQVNSARALLQTLVAGQTKLFEFAVSLTVGGEHSDELNANMKGLKSACSAKLMSIAVPRLFQGELITGKLRRGLFGHTATVAAFFPFVSSEIIETPGGIFLGANQFTGGPVVFDPYLRENTNFSILGPTGVGKSFATKIFLARMVKKYPNAAVFVVDPEGEYVVPVIAGIDAQADLMVLSPKIPAGLDPLKVFGNEKWLAIDMLAALLRISPERDPDLFTELRAVAPACSSIEEVKKNANKRGGIGKKLARYLDALVKGPDGFLVRGASRKIGERMVFNLKPLYTGLGRLDEFGTINAASLLVFGALWNRIQALPRNQPKIVVIDEFWLFMALPAAASFIAQLARRGRKRNVLFFFNSQRPADVLNVEAGRTALENAATKLIFNQDETSVGIIAEKFLLSDLEKDMVSNLGQGDAFILSGGTRGRLHFWATPDESSLFSSKPGDMED